MRYRTLDVRLWGDVKFRTLSPIKPSGQALFIYLLTNPNTTSIPGLYRAGAAGLAEELGWKIEDFLEAFREVLDQGLVKADLDSRVIFIPNAIKYNKPQSPNVVKSWAMHWDEIPECELKRIAHQEFEGLMEGFGKSYVEAFHYATSKSKRKTKPNQEQEHEQEITTTHVNCPHNDIIALYHEMLVMCPQVIIWHKSRQAMLQARWKADKKHQTLDWWRGYFEHVKKSDLLTGKIAGRDGKPPFVADLEWLIRPNNFAKVIEGKYHAGAI